MSDRSAEETTFKGKKHTHPFTVMQPFVLQQTHTRAHTHTHTKIKMRKIITSTLLMDKLEKIL